jgi:hypothetical protein
MDALISAYFSIVVTHQNTDLTYDMVVKLVISVA